MDKSQLRKLTQEFAEGELDEAEFQRVRAKLIDDIAEGRVTIVREPTHPPVLLSTQAAPPPPSPASTDATSIKPIYVVIGVIVLGTLIWALYPSQPEPTDQPMVITTVRSPLETKPPGPGERLVGEFLKANNWVADDLTQFATTWSALTDVEREETRASGELERLLKAILRELNAQQALAALDDSGAAQAASVRIHQLGQTLKMGDRLPKLNPPPAPIAAADTEILPSAQLNPDSLASDDNASADTENTVVSDLPDMPDIEATDTALAQPGQELTTESAEVPQTSTAQPETQQEVDGNSGGYTIQLFAMSTLESAQAVLADHQGIALNVVSLPASVPPHRIIFGDFQTTGEAETAYAKLPASLTQNRTKPVIKSRPELLPTQARVVVSTPLTYLDRSQQWLRAQLRDQLTLQLFAMNAEVSVKRVLSDHANLDLKVHHSDSPLSRFRILYGVYNSRTAALAGFASLPKSLTAGSGSPVVKSFAELQDTWLAVTP